MTTYVNSSDQERKLFIARLIEICLYSEEGYKELKSVVEKHPEFKQNKVVCNPCWADSEHYIGQHSH